MAVRAWLALLRPGDYLTVLVAVAATVLAALQLWGPDRPSLAVVRAGGKIVASLPLDRPGGIEVMGPLGKTLIEVQPGRARVVSDPGPRQYCVKQGWLTRSGAAAICAPNEVSLQLQGRSESYDSLSY
ncbi:NusG domain II-containing protein [Uliginosibacterium aquaticum]|uniref:NusG domain II-containing protein n=1 Tax=Uliginosibacterium aquaticum TaxID=2731212 RepID=A0ABX2IGW9_9RHOO|nr:NusG domain II-containing protein [Uliginosibacterium aquaticum]NSL55998.1 NusG domain II-containing protein [Uliginosibacterium aquaticum]